jgi:hypothetical protein
MHVTSAAFTCRDVVQRDDVAVVLGDPVGLEQVRFAVLGHRHLALCAWLRTIRLSITAAKRITLERIGPVAVHCASMMPSCTIEHRRAEKVPITEP